MVKEGAADFGIVDAGCDDGNAARFCCGEEIFDAWLGGTFGVIIPFEIGLELVDNLSDAEGAGVVVLGIADAFRKVVFGEDLWQIAAGR